jgi:hypothetical protein
VVPHAYLDYFGSAATAAAALIGLLFVAVSLRDDDIFGKHSLPGNEALAISAFTGLVNAFFVSLLALIPLGNIGWGAGVMGVISVASVISLQRRLPPTGRVTATVLTYVAYASQLVVAGILIVHPADHGVLNNLTYILIASMAAALQRAWLLIKRKHPVV